MSTLSKQAIVERMNGDETPKNKLLVITPLLSASQVGDASVDVRLGNQFIIFSRHTLKGFEPYKMDPGRLRRMQRRQIVRFGNSFVLHPGMLALGCTFEYVSIPHDLECQIEGRSSWARLGLQIATANSVEPYFKGVLTLELSNVGTIPVELFPGWRIAQLVFHNAVPSVLKPCAGRKYKCPVGPQFSRVHTDEDGKIFTSFWQ